MAVAALRSPRIANADDYAGQTYGDAAGAIRAARKKAVTASRSGQAGANDNCVVTHSQSAPWLKGEHFTPVTKTVLLDLNCNAKVATAKRAGNSAASPEGRAELEEAKQAAAKKSSSTN